MLVNIYKMQFRYACTRDFNNFMAYFTRDRALKLDSGFLVHPLYIRFGMQIVLNLNSFLQFFEIQFFLASILCFFVRV